MSQDVTQWLAEIQDLKQKLAQAQTEREQAYSSAANWRRLYETEAQQRRTEANLARQTVDALKLEIQQLRGDPVAGSKRAALSAIEAEVEQLQSPSALRQKLIEALSDRDRLIQALKTEQANHAQTRKSLTTALGDAIDLLSKEQGQTLPPQSSPE